jgi:hypothetical protein
MGNCLLLERLGRDSEPGARRAVDSDRLSDRGATMTVAGPVVLWPLLVVFVWGLLVGAVWMLLVAHGRRNEE